MSQVVTITTEQTEADGTDNVALENSECKDMLAAVVEEYIDEKETTDDQIYRQKVQSGIDNAEELREIIESFRPVVQGDLAAQQALKTALDNIDFILENLNSFIKANDVADCVVRYGWIFLAIQSLLPSAQTIEDGKSTYLEQCLQLLFAVGTVTFVLQCIIRFHMSVKLNREVENVDQRISRWEETYVSKLAEDRDACERAIEELKKFFHDNIYESDKNVLTPAEERMRALNYKEKIYAVHARLGEYETDLKAGKMALTKLQEEVQKMMRMSYAGQLGGLALAAGGAAASAIGVYNNNSNLVVAGGAGIFFGLGILTLSADARAKLEKQLGRLEDGERVLNEHNRRFRDMVGQLECLLKDVQQDQEAKRLRAQIAVMQQRMNEMELRHRNVNSDDLT